MNILEVVFLKFKLILSIFNHGSSKLERIIVNRFYVINSNSKLHMIFH